MLLLRGRKKSMVCLGVGVMMLLALTVERYVSVCHPGQHTRPLCGPPHLTVILIPLATFLVYLPSVFRGEITTCLLAPGGPVIYQKRENQSFLDSLFYQVSSENSANISRGCLRDILHAFTDIFPAGLQSDVGNHFQSGANDPPGRLQPAHNDSLQKILRASATDDAVENRQQRRRPENVRRRTKTRAAPGQHQHPVPGLRQSDGDPQRHLERKQSQPLPLSGNPPYPRSLTLRVRSGPVRGETDNFLPVDASRAPLARDPERFVTRAVSTGGIIREHGIHILETLVRSLKLFRCNLQVFRALANLLEVINYSITFYIYCLFSEDFRNTLIRTLQWPWGSSSQDGRGLPMKRSPVARPTTTTTTTPPTTAVATPGHVARASV